MADRLHPWLVALTLLDLGFVMATGAVGGIWLMPLWLLALASPWLRRYQARPLCRVAWNVGVLAAFSLLVQRASTAGVHHLLEDGLLLAVLCQVHLLNNVGERQRPDLIFFNSFLIAFVTCFFAPDVSWSLLFALHAFALLVALQLHAALRHAGANGRLRLLPLVRDAARHGLWIGAATLLVFAFLPRDFARRGWLGDAMDASAVFGPSTPTAIRLDAAPRNSADQRIVLRVRPISGRAADVPTHWRLQTYGAFDGGKWQPQGVAAFGSRFATDPVWLGTADGWRRGDLLREPRLVVELLERGGGRLPLPLDAGLVQPTAASGVLLDPKVDGSVGFVRAARDRAEPLGYELALAAEPLRTKALPRARELLRSAPPAPWPSALAPILQAVGRSADAAEAAARAAGWLQANRTYQLPGGDGFAADFASFVAGKGTGHCEYFAATCALLLRAQGHPCRLVGGFLAHEWDEERGEMVVRGRDGHAWVEVLLDDGSWLTVEATPPQSAAAAEAASSSWFDGLQRSLTAGWNRLVGFDAKSRQQLLAAVGGWLVAFGPWLLAGVGLAVAAIRWRRHRRLPRAQRELHKALRGLALVQQPGETLRELLVRVRPRAEREGKRVAALERAVALHEADHYQRRRSAGVAVDSAE